MIIISMTKDDRAAERRARGRLRSERWRRAHGIGPRSRSEE
jgi:hypothetical protein